VTTEAQESWTETAGGDTPEVLKRLLRSALRQERERAQLTQKAAADHVLWSLSKLIRIETGPKPASPADVRVLLLEYGVPEERVAELVALARAARQPDQWAQYKDVYSDAALSLFANEAAAKVIEKYEPSLIPGILQTPEYAKALLTALGTPADQLQRKLEVRLRRQELLDAPDCPDLDFIIGEAAVARPAGSSRIMREQIAHLKKLSERDNITLQLLPFAAGVHQGIGLSFTIVEFKDTRLPDLLYLESVDKESVTRDDPEALNRYSERFLDLKDLASPSDDFGPALDGIARALYSKS
jgi:hypothetical protein